jgi:aminopeptidase-like protein
MAMNLNDLRREINLKKSGIEMYQLITELYPICRSITGNGFRESLRILQQHVPLETHEVATGTQVFDWTIPKEWNIRDAYVRNSRGEKVIDFKKSNLHILQYSVPVKKKLPLAQLKEHLFSIPERPGWIPYRTSYYKENWGFCLSYNEMQNLEDGEYEVCIDSSLEDGHLTYGEYFLQGKTSEEVLLSCHSCHPSLCNDNLSGVALTTFLAELLTPLSLRYSYRFLFIPGSIGSIAWLSANEHRVSSIKHGLVVACVGDPGHLTYKKSRRGDAEIDTAVQHVLKHSGQEYSIREFSPYGYDERQFCSPGFNLPVGSLTRTPHGEYPEYHTSADNLALVQPEYLADSLDKYLAVIEVLENNKIYLNQNPKCEPQLGKRGLYTAVGGRRDSAKTEMAILWVLNLSDGEHSLLDIAETSGLTLAVVVEAADALSGHGLLKEVRG